MLPAQRQYPRKGDDKEGLQKFGRLKLANAHTDPARRAIDFQPDQRHRRQHHAEKRCTAKRQPPREQLRHASKPRSSLACPLRPMPVACKNSERRKREARAGITLLPQTGKPLQPRSDRLRAKHSPAAAVRGQSPRTTSQRLTGPNAQAARQPWSWHWGPERLMTGVVAAVVIPKPPLRPETRRPGPHNP